MKPQPERALIRHTHALTEYMSRNIVEMKPQPERALIQV